MTKYLKCNRCSIQGLFAITRPKNDKHVDENKVSATLESHSLAPIHPCRRTLSPVDRANRRRKQWIFQFVFGADHRG